MSETDEMKNEMVKDLASLLMEKDKSLSIDRALAFGFQFRYLSEASQ